MASPQKKLLQALRKQRDEKEYYKPMTHLRKAEKLPVTYFTAAKSNFKDETNYCLVVHYTMNDSKCFTYLTGQYKSPNEKVIKDMEKTFNDGVKDGTTPLWFVYYGMSNKTHEFDFLEEDEEINAATLEKCKSSEKEEWERDNVHSQYEPSPKKKKSTD